MIYYTNTPLHKPHLTFIGRWSPLHQGHIAIVNKKRSQHPKLPILMMVRDTGIETYTAPIRAEYVKSWMIANNIKGTIMIVPNIEGVYWGRDVGYNVGQVDVDRAVAQISGTAIRRDIVKGLPGWDKTVADRHASYILSPAISDIIDHGLVIWLTGCPSSGKTTIARALAKELHLKYPHIKTQLLDGDDVRSSPLATHVGFSKIDRGNHIRRMAYMAKMFSDHGIVVICAFVSPDRAVRQEAKKMIGKNKFVEIYVKASKETRIRRDAKGLYKKARQGLVTNLTGFNAAYEVPLHPNVICDTDTEVLSTCIRTIMTAVFPV